MKRSALTPILGLLLISGPAFSQLQTTIALLRTLGASLTQPYFVTDPGRQGLFYYDAKDITSSDNNGTVIVCAGRRYKRLYSGALDAKWFGMVGDYNGSNGSDNSPALMAAINAASTNQKVLVPEGQYLLKSTITLPLSTTKKVNLEIFGNIFASRITAFVIEGMNQDFRCYGMIAGLNTGATTEAAFAAYTGDGVYLKNAVNCYIEVNEIKDFRNGIHMSGDKNGGTNAGSQYNKIFFNSIHHNHTQIRISTKGTTTGGNWNNESSWYGGQVGRGIPNVTFGQGGWYGIVFNKEAGSNATDPMNGHVFHHVGFECIEKGLVMDNAEYNSFIGGRFEPGGSRQAIDLDPVTAVGNKFIGLTCLDETQFVTGRLGANTVISSTALWGGASTSKSYMGSSAVNSVTPNKLLVTTPIYSYTNFITNKLHDLISQTGQFPTLQAMMYRINGVVRSVPFKKTFIHVKTSTPGSPVTLPVNIGLVRIETNQEKVFRIDVGDMAAYGEEFIVEYLTPGFPISFVRSDNSAVLIAATQFPSGGIYRCVWADGQYKVLKLGAAEYKTVTQDGPNWTVADGTETHYINYQWANAVTTLPPAASWPGRVIIIKNLQAARTVSIAGVSAADENIIQGRGAMTVKSDGINWNIISFYKRSITY